MTFFKAVSNRCSYQSLANEVPSISTNFALVCSSFFFFISFVLSQSNEVIKLHPSISVCKVAILPTHFLSYSNESWRCRLFLFTLHLWASTLFL